jgi:hypothetical protein
MRLINFLLAATFLVIASLQVTAEYPVFWILTFGLIAIACLFAVFNYFPRTFLFSLLGFIILATVYTGLQQGFTKSMLNGPAALAVCALLLVFYLVRSFRIR